MEVGSAVITGAASGIGKEVALRLAAKGFALTLLDLDAQGLDALAQQIKIQLPTARVRVASLDVTDSAAQRAALEAHVAAYGGLQVAVLSAGIGERGVFLDEGNARWQQTLDVDLTAVLHGARDAALLMGPQQEAAAAGQPAERVILSVASAGAIYPMPVAPVYAAAKAGVAHFTRSAATMFRTRHSVRLVALCPEYVETPLVTRIVQEDPETAKRMLGSLDIQLLKPGYVAQVAVDMIGDAATYKPGAVVQIRQNGKVQQPYAQRQQQLGGKPSAAAPPRVSEQQRGALAAWALSGQPTSCRKVVVHQLSSDFAAATRVVQAPLPQPCAVPPGMLLVRRVYAGVNASDVNYSAGRYHASKEQAAAQLPFDAGFESVNVVMAVGEGVSDVAPGDAVACMSYGAFSDYGLEAARSALPVRRPSGQAVALLTSGLTASIALQEAGRLKAGEVVLVTAAAGGTGQFAVQLAKLAGCVVVATCGGPDKAALLRRLGADRVVDYRQEDLKAVLKREYPRGVDVVYESVGGAMFNTAVDALAQKGRIIIIGMMSSYGEGWPVGSYPGLAEKLLWKSASACGFFLLRYTPLFREHLSRLMALVDAGKLHVATDPRVFVGVDSVAQAVQYLHSGRSVGKVLVQLPQQLPPGLDVPAMAAAAGATAKL